MRRGNEEVCVLEIVRPAMEDSESAEKQENTGIGPGSACRGKSAFTRVFHALWMEVVASPSCAGLTRASIFFAKCFYEEGWIAGSSPAMRAVSVRAPLGAQPTSVQNDRRRRFPVSCLFFTGSGATPTCRAAEAHVAPLVVTIRRNPHMSASVVIMCLDLKLPCPHAASI